ncbi:RNA 2'-phosphotransferase [Flavobacterium sp. SORGH_AS_0622]|uniref:RNA 2'-phosphotransferase n=1 Tax=Flavobacterium sp. SORGH_AS_0622 TaxID=3041772 RepID=UPI002782AAFF|nr:RNA 2'-phosphotransferase [Flavobacterium sp. SORGH_AS_0622]MDQ1167843.1 putative RNA 2'-phosphotransferase [Flavobacterium sp. SORGH_AS_0622]
MNEKETKSISKFLSLVLRHSPEKIGLKLDENGWADVNELIEKCTKKGNRLDAELLDYVVENNDKKRFAFNEDKTKIRASQGHSISVDLNLTETEPSEYLYHGTVGKFIESIQKEGLQKMSRQHVHLSKDRETAVKVGSRRGIPQILSIRSGQMHRDGFKFYLSENNVWLTDEVPTKYIDF